MKEIPTDKKEEKKPAELATVGQLFSFAKDAKTRLQIRTAIAFSLVSGSCFPATAFYFATAFEGLSGDPNDSGFGDTVREISLTFVVLGVLLLVSMTAQNALMELAATTMTHNLQSDWFRALLRQDMSYHDLQDSGQASIVALNARKYRRGVGKKVAEACQFIVTFVGGMGYSFYASWETSLVVLGIAPFMTLSVLFLVRMNTSQTARANATYARAGSIAYTAVTSLRTVLSLNAVPRVIEEYKDATQEAYQGAVSQVAWVGLANGSQMASFILAYVVVTLFGSWILYDNVRDTGCDPSGTNDAVLTCNPAGVDVFGALFGITIAASVLPQISVAIESFTGARSACFPAIQVIQRTSEIDATSNEGKKPSSVAGDVEYRNVRFSYPARPDAEVFSDFSLKLQRGQTVALVGASGSGKSTAASLLERFYDPKSGSIALDGTDLKDLNINWLRQHIGMVSQEPKLFDMTIRQNIAAGAENVTDGQVEEAARMANAHDFIVSFPDGYDTQVGDLGGQLSGGQKQRIAIARVLVKRPKVLILDEATSALDSESEATVQKALDSLMNMKSMTTLVIAHRLSTVKKADVIAVVANGQVIESGPHDELISKGGAYADLVNAQQLKQSKDADLGSSIRDGESDSEHFSSHGKDLSEHDKDTPVFRFRDVDFSFPARPDTDIFRGLNLTVRSGETLAIVGPSGSGKSTCIQLMESFYHPNAGVVEFNGVDVKTLNVKWLRDQLGLVSQEPVLFDTSVAENIRYGCPGATQTDIENAAKMANAHDFIAGFPDGYGTIIGQGSNLVSGGQKQRIAIARALLKKPRVLLLDEATSALDSKSEAVVQEAIDKLIYGGNQTCVVIAHRLSTIRNADRIAVIDRGQLREIGTHDELMAKQGRYAKLISMQDLHGLGDLALQSDHTENDEDGDEPGGDNKEEKEGRASDEPIVDEVAEKVASKRAMSFGKDEVGYFLIGGFGAILAGLLFPSWGFIFAYMIEVLYTRVEKCIEDDPLGFGSCLEYQEDVADAMQEKSYNISYAYAGIFTTTMVGFTLLFWGFGTASERINKRVRDDIFTSLLRQEVAWFDMRSPGSLTSRLAEDAALMHAFSGEPIRTLVLSLSSVLVGVVVSFVYMWPFALLAFGILPFMGFGAEMEMKMYLGEDEGDDSDLKDHSPSGILLETLSNVRTVASMTLEERRLKEYSEALDSEDMHPVRNSIVKGGAGGLGQFVQMWGLALMFFFGGWLLENSDDFTFRDYLISMFALFFSLYALATATQGAVDRGKAKTAAARIFELMDRKSEIDPLSDSGLKDV